MLRAGRDDATVEVAFVTPIGNDPVEFPLNFGTELQQVFITCEPVPRAVGKWGCRADDQMCCLKYCE